MIELLFAHESVVVSHTSGWNVLKERRDEFICLEMARKCILFFHFILFYFSSFYFILFYFILFYFILFYFILFYFILFPFGVTLINFYI